MIGRKNSLLFLLILSLVEWSAIALFTGYFRFWFSSTKLEADPSSYMAAAHDLVTQLRPDSLRPLGISLLFGLPYLFTDSFRVFLVANIFLQLVAWLTTIYLLFRLGSETASGNFRRAPALLFSLSIAPIALSFQVLSETYFILFLVGAIFCTDQFIRTRNKMMLLLGYLLLCCSALIRPLIYYFVLLVTLWLILFFVIGNLKQNLRFLLLVVLTFTCTIGLQLLVMYFHFGVFTLSDSMGKVLWMWAAHAECLADGRTDVDHYVTEWMNAALKQCQQEGRTLNEVISNRFMEQADSNPIALVHAYIVSLKYNLLSGSSAFTASDSLSRLLYGWSLIQNVFYSFALLLLITVLIQRILLRKVKRHHYLIMIIASAAAYLYLMGGFFYWQGDRYHAPAFPLICLSVPFLFNELKALWHEARNRYSRAE